ncbi:MAG: hypothetical protein K2K08_09810 [Paramuribaculum sp.]|nr:hypothetical protein [Paramuribaculum sp.]
MAGDGDCSSSPVFSNQKTAIFVIAIIIVMNMRIKKFLTLIFMLSLCVNLISCSENQVEKEEEEEWICGTMIVINFRFGRDIPARVISAGNEILVMPLDTVPDIKNDSTIMVLRQLKEGDYSYFGSKWNLVDLKPFVGKNVLFTGYVRIVNKEKDTIKIDGVDQVVTKYIVEQLSVREMDDSRSAQSHETECGTMV